jgi:hypothetical protein
VERFIHGINNARIAARFIGLLAVETIHKKDYFATTVKCPAPAPLRQIEGIEEGRISGSS